MAQSESSGAAEAERAQRLATPLYWASAAGANVALIAGRELSDIPPALGAALVCEAAVYLALWSFMQGVRWAAAPAVSGRRPRLPTDRR